MQCTALQFISPHLTELSCTTLSFSALEVNVFAKFAFFSKHINITIIIKKTKIKTKFVPARDISHLSIVTCQLSGDIFFNKEKLYGQNK